jgi:hypothetical protein
MNNEYEVKIMIEYWVTVEADSEEQAQEKAYMEYDEWLHTGTLYSAEAYPIRQDLDNDEDSE